MYEQAKAKSFMQQLGQWVEGAVVTPLLEHEDEITLEVTIVGVKKAIREKVLESYRNGQQAVPAPEPQRAPAPRERRYARRK